MRRVLSFLTALCLLLTLGEPVQSQSALNVILTSAPPAKIASSGLLLRLEADNLASQWQTISATTPVAADGDVVGTWQDMSGNGFDLTAPGDNTTRPTHRITNGYHRNSCDGVDDALKRAASLGIYAAGSATIMVAMRHDASDQGSHLSEGYSGASSPLYDIMQNNGTDLNDAQTFVRNGAATAIINFPLLYDESFISGTDIVYTIVDSGSSVTAYVDNSAGPSSAYTRSGDFSLLNQFSICRDAKVGGGGFVKVDIAGVWVWNRVLNGNEFAAAVRYAKKKQGR